MVGGSLQSDDDDDDEKPDIISFDDDVQEIMAQLLTDEKSSFVISIVGVKGIGKTTLAKLVYDNDAVADHFPYRAWASSKQLALDFPKDILKPMDLNKSIPTLWKEEEENIQRMAEEAEHRTPWTEQDDFRVKKMREKEEEELWSLFNAFLKDKKCLIVVDGIYSITSINNLLTRFSNSSSGSQMILILTNLSLLSDLPKKGLHLTLQLRDDNESWALFTHILKVTIPPELQSLRGDILKTCCGLPLIIKKLAVVLSHKDATIEDWSGVLQRLNGDQEFRSHILYEINDSLPLHMKQCLFYFGLFPQSFEIPIRRLIALWIADGFGVSKRRDRNS